ncbi:putative RNA-directed DNA polymerase from mobile element jockey-like 73 [Homarus americanus]|uniref:Putative RNA-directed DNA polymerase from mobile element jockey-like 73 n=1 Tax=Homarus americanus TaxID=6706 RepID=A0A8J5MN11_HOMAM|nr:putative RNA-directed DNA polymerase from mobile element jockey-like 73 [Homarus americanus]
MQTAATPDSPKTLSEVTNQNGKTVKQVLLDPEEKTTEVALLRYTLELPTEAITKHPKVIKAERCVTSQGKAQMRQVLLNTKGTAPEELDLGNWRIYKMRPFVPEPLRCYKCQEFGHHQSKCYKKGGRLDPVAHWEVDAEMTSDHFAKFTTLRVEILIPPPRPPPAGSNYEPTEGIDQLNRTPLMPYNTQQRKEYQKQILQNKHHKDYWFYTDEDSHRKTAQNFTPPPATSREANRLAEHFEKRSSPVQLLSEIRLHLQQVQLEREVVRQALEQTDNTGCLFTIEETRRARETNIDTAPGSDGITFSLLSNTGPAGN